MEPDMRCFRDGLWDPGNAKCAGGLDPTAIDTRTGGRKVMPQCRFFETCRDKKIGSSSMTRANPTPPSISVPGIPQRPPAPYKQPQHPTAQYAQQGQMVPTNAGEVMMMPPWQAYYGAPMVPVQQAAPSPVPSALAQPEPIVAGVSTGKRLATEMARAGIGTMLQQAAYAMLNWPWSKPEPRE